MVQSPNLCYPENDCGVSRDYVAAGQYNYPCMQVIVTYREMVEVNYGNDRRVLCVFSKLLCNSNASFKNNKYKLKCKNVFTSEKHGGVTLG